MDLKKQKEREILFTVFPKDQIEKILIEDETPDFIITDVNGNTKIGIEITTVFTSAASAISRDSKFLDKYTDQNRPGTKENKKKPEYLNKLKVADVENAEDFVHKEAVVWHIANPLDTLNSLDEIIQKKQSSYTTQIKKLEFVSLIAKDEDNIFKQTTDVDEFYLLFKQSKLFHTIINSTFQEVYFISEFKSGTFIIPLKWLIIRHEFELFLQIWQQNELIHEHIKHNYEIITRNFSVCLMKLGFKNIYRYSTEGNWHISSGAYYLRIDKETLKREEFKVIIGPLPPEELKISIFYKDVHEEKPIFIKYSEFREDMSAQLPLVYYWKI